MMIRFKEPVLRDKIDCSYIHDITWPVIEEVKLIHRPLNQENLFLSVLESRCTRREFSKIEKQQVGELLYLSHRVVKSEKSVNGLTVQHRPVISAGGLHAINTLVHFPGESNWYRYDPIRHIFQCLKLNISTEMLNVVRSFFPSAQDAVIIWYLGDLSILSAKYEYTESLLFRDAGAIMSTQSLISEHLDYAYCPLGITGDKYANKLLNESHLIGVGIALVGNRI